ncbi:hypothetical protein [Nitrosomonas sp. JL21]|uniref:hypothetical protein n=1 Tax=Nitrosomonas sp. JL21 TaxID=153949 RepID=UPI00136D68AD|nr:hypothetical protein [Nitrosomonas sp. JL21]MBL8497328.1 hypothetical protein [Nitrosomonas sp.]
MLLNLAQAAAMLNVSTDSVQFAKKVLERAFSHRKIFGNTPPLLRSCRSFGQCVSLPAHWFFLCAIQSQFERRNIFDLIGLDGCLKLNHRELKKGGTFQKTGKITGKLKNIKM